jgi:hypothetical protein
VADADLATQILRPGLPTPLPDNRQIAGGMRAVVLLWIAMDSPAAVPHRLRHRMIVTMENVSGERTVEGAAVDVRGSTPLVIGPPLRGEGWMAGNGPSNQSTAYGYRLVYPLAVRHRSASVWRCPMGRTMLGAASRASTSHSYESFCQLLSFGATHSV